MRLEFVIDKEYDIRTALFLKLVAWNRFDNVPVTRGQINGQYSKSMGALRLTRKLYQDSWDEIGPAFSEYVERTTGYKWLYRKYQCVVSVITPGAPVNSVVTLGKAPNWDRDNKIVRIWQENPYWMRRITAHELIETHYFEIYRRHFSDAGLTEGQVWALGEIAAWAMTSLTREAGRFWPWRSEYYTNHNYPHVVDLQLRLKSAFLKRRSFDGYVRKGIELVRKYPGMNPNGT